MVDVEELKQLVGNDVLTGKFYDKIYLIASEYGDLHESLEKFRPYITVTCSGNNDQGDGTEGDEYPINEVIKNCWYDNKVDKYTNVLIVLLPGIYKVSDYIRIENINKTINTENVRRTLTICGCGNSTSIENIFQTDKFGNSIMAISANYDITISNITFKFNGNHHIGFNNQNCYTYINTPNPRHSVIAYKPEFVISRLTLDKINIFYNGSVGISTLCKYNSNSMIIKNTNIIGTQFIEPGDPNYNENYYIIFGPSGGSANGCSIFGHCGNFKVYNCNTNGGEIRILQNSHNYGIYGNVGVIANITDINYNAQSIEEETSLEE